MITVFSDGGADSRGHSAGASIIQFSGSESSLCESPLCVAAYLGGATNNEAEIFSAIMGFSFVLIHASKNDASKIKWVSDSEYSIKSATQYIHAWKKNGWQTAQKKPVKNQGLWKTFDALVSGVKILPEHVYGHSGHPENESCDTAVGWIRKNGGVQEDGVYGIDTPAGSDWFLFDGSAILEEIRTSEEKGLGRDEIIAAFLPFAEGSKEARRSNPSEKKNTSSEDSQTSEKTLQRVKKITGAYLQKLKEIDPKGEVLNANPALKEALKSLERSLK